MTTAIMKTGDLTQLTRKLAVFTGIIGASTFFCIPVMAQITLETQSPAAGDTTQPPAATTPSPVPTDNAVPPATRQQTPAGTAGAASGNIVVDSDFNFKKGISQYDFCVSFTL
ncbi:MAG: hypothetical protein KME30_17960 [Iphinoe sp. HA4291-MV1]|nr:hypothetical protein [Iphinoe sp. HA4291-MV1]